MLGRPGLGGNEHSVPPTMGRGLPTVGYGLTTVDRWLPTVGPGPRKPLGAWEQTICGCKSLKKQAICWLFKITQKA